MNRAPTSNQPQLSRLNVALVGFTLIELMVVLVILSIMMSLALAGLAAARNSGKIAKTRSTIRKLSEVILPYYESFETRRPTLPDVSGLVNRGSILDVRRAALRRLIAMELPDRLSDITGAFSPLVVNGVSVGEISPVTRRYDAIVTDPNGPFNNKPRYSAQLLYLILMRGPVADPDVISHFRRDEMADTNEDGVPDVFVDGWQQPIEWLRWPIGFPSPYQPLDGRLSSRDERFSVNGHRLVPLIYSGGVDQEYEVHLIDDSMTPYIGVSYDPFQFVAAQGGQFPPTNARGEVSLYRVTWGSGPSTIATYAASTADRSELVAAGGTIDNQAFLTVGSPFDADGGGSVNASQSINNHAMSR